MVMDMPITVPRISVTQAGDDLKARDMLLCRFPEVEMVVGKAGRAETPFDPAPLDMIETMVDFRPVEFWPKRKLHRTDAEQHGWGVMLNLIANRLCLATVEPTDFKEAVAAAHSHCELGLREYAYLRHQEFQRRLGPMLIQTALARLAEQRQQAKALRQLRASSAGGLRRLGLPGKRVNQIGRAHV